MDKLIDKALDIMREFLSRLTAKRLAAWAAYLFYMSYVFYMIVGKQAVNNYEVIVLEALVFIGLPTVGFLYLIWSFTKQGGGDELTAPTVEISKEEQK